MSAMCDVGVLGQTGGQARRESVHFFSVRWRHLKSGRYFMHHKSLWKNEPFRTWSPAQRLHGQKTSELLSSVVC